MEKEKKEKKQGKEEEKDRAGRKVSVLLLV
jgi:hypothetical protein